MHAPTLPTVTPPMKMSLCPGPLCYVWYLIQQKTLTSSPLLSTVLHACDVGINMDGHEHGHGESRINKKYIYIKFASNITI